jgi:MOSC domain-containing protein YiiM
MATITSINISQKKGERKKKVDSAVVTTDHGIESDAHAGKWHRQVSLLATESIRKMQKLGLDVGPGDFAENLTTEGIDLVGLPVGTKLQIGEKIEVEVTQIGKECHNRCAIYEQAGDCVMPREGIFVRVLSGGQVKAGDAIHVKQGE